MISYTRHISISLPVNRALVAKRTSLAALPRSLKAGTGMANARVTSCANFSVEPYRKAYLISRCPRPRRTLLSHTNGFAMSDERGDDIVSVLCVWKRRSEARLICQVKRWCRGIVQSNNNFGKGAARKQQRSLDARFARRKSAGIFRSWALETLLHGVASCSSPSCAYCLIL